MVVVNVEVSEISDHSLYGAINRPRVVVRSVITTVSLPIDSTLKVQ